jgi:hypothetical protein
MIATLDLNGPLEVEILENGRSARVLSDYVCMSDREIIKVPANFLTDFASTPRIFWSIWPPIGTYTDAAVVHDYLYSEARYPREMCDRLFLYLMLAGKTNKFSARIIYRTVRIFGASHYCKKKE